MNELGNGILAVWNDVSADAEVEFNDWHLREHLAERLSIPGFLRARRWWNPERSPRYFTSYETRDVSVLGSAEYLRRLENPSPRARRIMPSFRSTNRSVCCATARIRSGDGGVVSVLRLSADDAAQARLRSWLSAAALPRAVACRGMVAVQLWECDQLVTSTNRLESTLRPGRDETIGWAVVLEATRVDEIADAEAIVSDALVHGATTLGQPEHYSLLCAMTS